MVLHKGSTPDSEQKTHEKVMGKILVAGKRLQSNRENREQQKYFWNIVLQEKSQSGVRKLRTLGGGGETRLSGTGGSHLDRSPCKSLQGWGSYPLYIELRGNQEGWPSWVEYRSGGTGGPTWFISHPSSTSVTSLISPLSPLSDQQRFSPNNITTSSKGKVMRIIKKITIKEMFWSFNKLFSKKMYGG